MTTTYRITATYTPDSDQLVGCSTPEVLGESYGATYDTQGEAQAAADALQESVGEYELHPSTTYHVEEVEKRESMEWRCSAGNAEPISCLDPQDGDTVVDLACDAWSLRWEVIAERCRDAGLVLVFKRYDDEAKSNLWAIRSARSGEEAGSCVGI